MEIAEVVLCKVYFSSLNTFKNRPVLVLKDNLPYNDFIGIPISSQIERLQFDEFIISNNDFENGKIPKQSKVMIRKVFTISKNNVIKIYGKLNKEKFTEINKIFCNYFECKG